MYKKRAGAFATGSLSVWFQVHVLGTLKNFPFHPEDHFTLLGIIGNNGHRFILVSQLTGRVEYGLNINRLSGGNNPFLRLNRGTTAGCLYLSYLPQ